LHHHIQAHKLSQTVKFEYKANNAVKQLFNTELEQHLLKYIKQAARMHYGISKLDVLKLVYQYAAANKLKYPHQWDENILARGEWMRAFLKKYGEHISLRKPESTSLARSTSFSKLNVQQFFNNVKAVHEKHGPFPPQRIYNVDETGLSTVHVPPKILVPKGIMLLGSITFGERGQNVTLIAAINAVGDHLPPMLIFPRVRYKEFMLKGTPIESKGGANPSRWSNERLFMEFLDHFIEHAKPPKEEPVLLFLDNHESHVNVPVNKKASDTGIIMITFSPHISHKLQPPDRTVFGSFRLHYNRAVNDWMSSNPGKTISIYEVAQMVGRAFLLAFTSSNILSGFAATGISPLNEDVFPDDDFLSSYVSAPSSSRKNEATVPPDIIRPFPKAQPRKPLSKGRKKGKSRILTDTPNK
jgi:hypothetical protein